MPYLDAWRNDRIVSGHPAHTNLDVIAGRIRNLMHQPRAVTTVTRQIYDRGTYVPPDVRAGLVTAGPMTTWDAVGGERGIRVHLTPGVNAGFQIFTTDETEDDARRRFHAARTGQPRLPVCGIHLNGGVTTTGGPGDQIVITTVDTVGLATQTVVVFDNTTRLDDLLQLQAILATHLTNPGQSPIGDNEQALIVAARRLAGAIPTPGDPQ